MKCFTSITFYSVVLVIYCLSYVKISEAACSEGQFTCTGSSSRCISESSVCNGKQDCIYYNSDYSDEQNCDSKFNHSFCPQNQFNCYRSQCRYRSLFCNGVKNCPNGYDEKFCDSYKTRFNGGCPTSNWWQCDDGRCIPDTWKCDSLVDCEDESDEKNCVYPSEMEEIKRTQPSEEVGFLGDSLAQRNLVKWFTSRRKNGATVSRWGHELARTVVALFLGNREFFAPGNRTLEEMSYELNIQLLSLLAGEGKINKNDLATYIHALVVTCNDPFNFHGRDLVAELRAKVEETTNKTTNPFDILALCNAGDKMSTKDAERVMAAYDTGNRPFWIDNQAMATIALSCISSNTDVTVDERTLMDMEQELKKRQFRNGTVENLKTTALVLQALIATRSYQRDFNLEAALKVILQNQKADGSIGSFLESYYILPALSNSSLADIFDSHCQRPSVNDTEEETLSKFQRARGEKVKTQYSVWIGSESDLRKTWTLKVPLNSSLYDILEIANRLDNRQRIQYSVIEGKPYVSSVTGLQDDIERGLYWFICIRALNSTDPKLVEESPVDVKIAPNQELILWYKSG